MQKWLTISKVFGCIKDWDPRDNNIHSMVPLMNNYLLDRQFSDQKPGIYTWKSMELIKASSMYSQ